MNFSTKPGIYLQKKLYSCREVQAEGLFLLVPAEGKKKSRNFMFRLRSGFKTFKGISYSYSLSIFFTSSGATLP